MAGDRMKFDLGAAPNGGYGALPQIGAGHKL
jgi:hypothetical protein